MFEASLLPSAFLACGVGPTLPHLALNGSVPLNKVWFPGSRVLNRVVQLHHLAPMSSTTGFRSGPEALSKV